MSIISIYFPVFLIVLTVLYYALPKKCQWMVLLVGSLGFYAASGLMNLLYILGLSAVAWAVTLTMQKKTDEQKAYLKENKTSLSKDEKKEYKLSVKKQKRSFMLLGIIPIILLLVFFKLLNPINFLLESKGLSAMSIIIPLGLSYYTIQTVGYVVDVYWSNVKAEKNYFKVLLFVSFFPQVTQGPINDFKQLTGELFAEHEFTYDNFSRGIQRIMWGFLKKMAIADAISPYVKTLFTSYYNYNSVALLIGAFICMLQLYADFSGYMDIVCGSCDLLGIRLTENFRRPFFSKSLSEFWTRWHITMGAWFRKYVYYPIGVSNLIKKLSDKSQKAFGEVFAEKFPMTVALFAVWTLIGFWHGADMAFILWGVFNGFIMIISVWLEPVYEKTRTVLKINGSSFFWKAFRCARIFILVSLLEVFSDAGGLKRGVNYMKYLFRFNMPKSLPELFPYIDFSNIAPMMFFAAIGGLFLVFLVSLFSRKKDFRDITARVPAAVRVIVLAGMFLFIISFGLQSTINNNGGFLYADF